MSWYEWVLYPAFSVPGIASLIWSFPLWLEWVLLGVGLVGAVVLMVTGLYGAFDSRSWVEGSRLQIPLMMGSSVLGTITFFAGSFLMISELDPLSFSECLDASNAFLYSASTWAVGEGVGIGVSEGPGRILTVVETFVGLGTIVLIVSTAVSKAYELRGRATSQGSPKEQS